MDWQAQMESHPKNVVKTVACIVNCWTRIAHAQMESSLLKSRYEVQIQQLCSSAVYKQNVSILLCLSNSVRCSRGYYF